MNNRDSRDHDHTGYDGDEQFFHSDYHDAAGVDADPTAGWQAGAMRGLRLTWVRGVPLAGVVVTRERGPAP